MFGLDLRDEGFAGDLVDEVGMPIGNLTSQMIANLYLNELDQFAKHELRIRHYVRYMDDVLILHHDKSALWETKAAVEDFLDTRLQLKLNKKTCIRTHTQGVDWVGCRVWPTHIKLRKSTAQRMKKRLKFLQELYAAGEIGFNEVNASVQGYMGLLKHCDSYNLRKSIFESLVFARSANDEPKFEEYKVG